MKTSLLSYSITVAGSLLVGLLLSVIALPPQYVWLRPQWVCLVVLYWAMFTPQYLGVSLAWLIGLVQDFISGGVWGAHALGLAVVAYVAQIAYQRLCAYSIWQQCFWIFILVGVHQIGVNGLESLKGFGGPIQWVLLPSIISALCWPLLVRLLHRLQKHPPLY